MKNLLLLLLTTFALNSCSNSDDNKPSTPKTELEKLPPATHTGANTAGCLVNGKAFLPKGYFPSGNLFCNYIDGNDFVLSINQNVNQKIWSVIITSDSTELHNNIGVTFPLNIMQNNSKYGEYYIYNTDFTQVHYTTTSAITGEFVITHHNFNQAIISGTFWFDGVNSNGEKVEVREGRFDMHY